MHTRENGCCRAHRRRRVVGNRKALVCVRSPRRVFVFYSGVAQWLAQLQANALSLSVHCINAARAANKHTVCLRASVQVANYPKMLLRVRQRAMGVLGACCSASQMLSRRNFNFELCELLIRRQIGMLLSLLRVRVALHFPFIYAVLMTRRVRILLSKLTRGSYYF